MIKTTHALNGVVENIDDMMRLNSWACIADYNDDSAASTKETLELFYPILKKIMTKWDGSKINLYFHNCQHFSRFVGILVQKSECCSIE